MHAHLKRNRQIDEPSVEQKSVAQKSEFTSEKKSTQQKKIAKRQQKHLTLVDGFLEETLDQLH